MTWNLLNCIGAVDGENEVTHFSNSRSECSNEGSFFVVLQLVWMSTDLLQKLTWFGGGDWGSERELMQQ